jgi:hypothetical protein
MPSEPMPRSRSLSCPARTRVYARERHAFLGELLLVLRVPRRGCKVGGASPNEAAKWDDRDGYVAANDADLRGLWRGARYE